MRPGPREPFVFSPEILLAGPERIVWVLSVLVLVGLLARQAVLEHRQKHPRR